jgi:hypothetical protein
VPLSKLDEQREALCDPSGDPSAVGLWMTHIDDPDRLSAAPVEPLYQWARF